MFNLVVFYSLTGKSRQVAEKLAAMLSADLAEIIEQKPRGLTGRAMIRCLMDSFLRRRPAIRPMSHHAVAYDRVIVVCPVWAAHIAGPARTWLRVEGRAARRLALSLQLGGGPHGSVYKEIESLTGKVAEPAVEVMEEEFVAGTAMAKVEAFARSMMHEPTLRNAA